MKKASGKAEYRRIAAEIEIAIRRGVWQERLPSLQQLMKIYDVAKQPVTLALKLLKSFNILTFGGCKGMLINRTALSGGVIGIVVRYKNNPDDLLQDSREAMELIKQCGFQPVMIHVENYSDWNLPEDIFSRFSGLIFWQGTIREQLISFLNSRSIPFVSTNILPFSPELSYVNFDTEKAVRRLAEDFQRAGYKRIALQLSGFADGYNDKLKKMWYKIKKDLALEFLPCDRVRYHDGWDWNKNAMIFQESLQKMHPKPEVLIHYGRLPDELRKRYQECLPNYPWDMKLVSAEDRWGNPKLFPGESVIRSARTSRLLAAAFPVLLERMRNPQARPIHRLIPYNIEYITNPPEIRK